MSNNDNQNNKKWIPYFKRENSIYKKHPFLAWLITIIGIIISIVLIYNCYKDLVSSASYNAGYISVYQK